MWFVLGFAAASAQTVIVGADWGNADLVPAEGEVLEGVFTNVAEFVVDAGTTAYVQRDIQLEVYADTVTIAGVLDGTGGGLDGGNSAAPGPGGNTGSLGTGPGRGQGGLPGPCVHGGGGGGGGYGGPGGNGAYNFQGQAQGGNPYGDPEDPEQPFLGSGGGSGGSGCDLASGGGGRGGASILLVARIVTIDGELLANGARGLDGLQWSGGGGGGSGGSITIDAGSVAGVGRIAARGGPGGDTVQGVGGLAGGGGGGGGGRIKLLYGTLSPDLELDVQGGPRGQDQANGYASPGSAGGPGTTFTVLTDPDVDDDGIDVSVDNCPDIPNPDQADRDDDGIGDACDVCPDDPIDADGDGVCDSVDACPEGDDNADIDGDGQADACDCAPEDPLAQTDAIEACDGADNDCNSVIDDPGAEGEIDFFADLDGDGFGDPALIRRACFAPLNFISRGDDCNDASPASFPGNEEVCGDEIDNDCDGSDDPVCPSTNVSGENCGCAATPGPASVVAILLGALVLGGRRRRAASAA